MSLGCGGREPLHWDPTFPRLPVRPPAYRPFNPASNRCIAGGPPVHLAPAHVAIAGLWSDADNFEKVTLAITGAAAIAGGGAAMVGPGGAVSTVTAGGLVLAH